jgi:predicted nucleic acid-binding Zn ribbon protein
MKDKRKSKPEPIADVLSGWIDKSGIAKRIGQAHVVPDWLKLVGPQIAAVTAPTSVSVDGTLWVQVTTNAWMTELSLMEPQLLRALNAPTGRTPIRRIRWQLKRT